MILCTLLSFSLSLGALQDTSTVAFKTLAIDLQSPKWIVRRDAFERLLGPTDALQNPQISQLLLRLREKEDKESEREEPDLFEDDDYLAYDERLTKAVESIAETKHQKRAWNALLYSRYDANSRFGDWVASHPEAFPETEALIDNIHGPRRSNGLFLTAAMLARNDNGLFAPGTYRHIRSVIRAHVVSDIPPVRYDAMLALGLIGTRDDAVFLEKYADKCHDATLKELAGKEAQVIQSRLDPKSR